MSEIGYIYCMSNPAFKDGMVKIGLTLRTPEERRRELRTTGVPLPFVVEFAKQVINPAEKEKFLHTILAEKRISDDREFFNHPVEEVKALFEMFQGPWWVQEENQSSPRKRSSQEDRDEEARAKEARAHEKQEHARFKEQQIMRKLKADAQKAEMKAQHLMYMNQWRKEAFGATDDDE